MSVKSRFLITLLCIAVLAVTATACTVLTPKEITVPATVVVTATPGEGASAPEPTLELSPTPLLPTLTSEPPAATPKPPSAAPIPPTAPPTAAPTVPAEPPYEDRQDPIRLLASYYNAINRREYSRAWGYWESPPNPSYEDFRQGFAETAWVLLVVRPPAYQEGAAGSVYAAIPTLLSATHVDDSRHNFVGCFVARRPNIGDPVATQDWSLYSATLAASPGNSSDVSLLAEACPDTPATVYDDREGPVRLLASYYDAINRKDYLRAWEYWENPPDPSFEDFVQGFADTDAVLLAVRPPTFMEGAAGSVYTAIPALLSATHTDGSQHNFVGCFVARRPNVGDPDVVREWSLYDATVWVSPGNSSDATLLAQACANP
jgi:hypothetical protein